MKKNRVITLIIISILCVIGGIYIFFTQVSGPQSGFSTTIPNNTHVVTITENGFSPESLTIQKGESVTWVNNDMKPRWPASNLHPTHEIYSEFDPQEPLDPKQVWTFRFDKPGSWRYHDHLAPTELGTITVK